MTTKQQDMTQEQHDPDMTRLREAFGILDEHDPARLPTDEAYWNEIDKIRGTDTSSLNVFDDGFGY